MSGAAALHIVFNQASKICTRKFAMNYVGVKCKTTENKRLYNALLLDKFKQRDSSQ